MNAANLYDTILQGDALAILRTLPDGCVQACVTSPPYWGLRDYGTAKWEGGTLQCGNCGHRQVWRGPVPHTVNGTVTSAACDECHVHALVIEPCDHAERELRRGVNMATWAGNTRGGGKKAGTVGWLPYRDVCGKCGAVRVDDQLGLERTPEEYVARMVEVFREVKRVLRDDGTLFLNMGDSYYSNPGNGRGGGSTLSGAKPHLSGAQRVGAYGTRGITPEDSLAHDCLCRSLCDACRVAYRIGKAHSAHQHASMPLASSFVSNRAHTGLPFDHLPTSDSVHQGAHTSGATPDQRLAPAREGAPLPAAQVSTTHVSARQPLDSHSEVSSQGGVCQLCGRSLPDYAQVSVDTSPCPCEIDSSSPSKRDRGKSRRGNSLTDDSLASRTGGTAYGCSYPDYTISNLLKPKDLIGIPWMVAFALRADGWYLRADCIWHKPNPMPESVRDRPTKAHEYVFLLSKRPTYYYDADAIAEDAIGADRVRADRFGGNKQQPYHSLQAVFIGNTRRNKRSVWTIATAPYAGAHFATFPPALIEPCVLAGAPPGGIVLDPFFGSGTVGAVARRHSRHYLGVELNPAYIALAEQRIADEVQPVLWSIA